jgi:hypothetical protein
MRNPNSQFNHICNNINCVPVGQTFTTKEYIAAVGHYENVTSWKRYSKNPHYICHQYKGYLRRAGFISQVSRGLWKVEKHIPQWFDFGHLSALLGYHKWDQVNRKYITTYKGMNASDIKAKLNGASIAPAIIPTQDEPGLPKLRSTNRSAYNDFIKEVKRLSITRFNTKNELASFIESIKWPGVRNTPAKPRFAIQGNYSPIIDHLLADGIISESFDGYRYSYTVVNAQNISATAQVVKVVMEAVAPEVRSPKVVREGIVVKATAQPTILDKLQAMEYALIQMTAQVRELINEVKNK